VGVRVGVHVGVLVGVGEGVWVGVGDGTMEFTVKKLLACIM